jgi:hypothetical protein
VFVRIARFEGGDAAGIDAEIRRMEEAVEAAKRGDWGDMPEGLKRITRNLMLVDRATGNALDLNFCETEDDLRALDEALNSMSPLGASSGRRVSVEMFEVGLDSTFR